MKNTRKDFSGVQFQLRGMATSEKFQKKGLGKRLMKYAEQILKSEGVDVIWCNARTTATVFYKNLVTSYSKKRRMLVKTTDVCSLS